MGYHIIFVVLTSIFCFISVYGWLNKELNKTNLLKTISFFVFLVLAVSLPVVYQDTLSRPKSLNEEWFKTNEKVSVVSFVSKPGVGLYLLLEIPDIEEPRYYFLDWSPEARKLSQKLQEEFEKNGSAIMVFPFENSLEKERTIHPMPQPKAPEKEKPREVPNFKV